MVLTRPRVALLLAAVSCLAVTACDSGSSSDPTSPASTAPPATEAPTTEAPTTDPPATEAPTTVAEPVDPLVPTATGFAINWEALNSTPFYGETGGADPYFNIHTVPAGDGFLFSLELYTVYGTAWSGELGTFDIGCAPASTGICVHFDPDGPGPLGNLGADFLATGSLTINQLDDFGYDIVVHEVVFTDGTTITEFHMVGLR
ncbi:MAG: hypothetical protein ABL953_09140 [Ilumatobacteraceae bacterium]